MLLLQPSANPAGCMYHKPGCTGKTCCMKGNDAISILLKAGLVIMALMLLLRVYPPLALFLLSLCIIGLLTTGIILLFRAARRRRQEKRRLHTVAGQIERRMAECKERIRAFEQEVEPIHHSIAELEEQLQRTPSADALARTEAQRLISKFRHELKLRQSKISFFTSCLQRWEDLLQRHLLHQQLEAKKRQLQNLHHKHYDDLAPMESMRWQLEKEEEQVMTLTELSHRMAATENLETAEDLEHRLDHLPEL